MASSMETYSSCSSRRGACRRSWNGRERNVLRSRCRSLPPRMFGYRSVSGSASGQSAIEEELKLDGKHEEHSRASRECSRMRVGVRVRPVFQSEMLPFRKRSGGYEFRCCVSVSHTRISAPSCSGESFKGVECSEDGSSTVASSGNRQLPTRQACVELRMPNGRQRTFAFDHAFGATSQQHEIYNSLAAPVVEGCLAGLNGLVMAYGQTASGKSHTMGVLKGVDVARNDGASSSATEASGLDENDDSPHARSGAEGSGRRGEGESCRYNKARGAQHLHSHNQADPGIIPRALSRVFQFVQESAEPFGSGLAADTPPKVRVSLLQIYNETVQDLLTPAAPFGAENVGLNIRENPTVGFFVEGLREYAVQTHQDAAALINLGLQQRTTAMTQKNDISSRSHTVLTITLEQGRGWRQLASISATDVAKMAEGHIGSRARSKLVLVDLAGSERGRRSGIYVQQGPSESRVKRLREAGYINQSLSALGNVIAALGQAEHNRPHIPYRDSKLTRILADSLGGGANAALIATVGPAPQNQAESLSTLVFASRCMRVRSKPVTHEEGEQMETTLRLRAQLASMQREFCRREALQQSRYETVVTRLAQELEYARNSTGPVRPRDFSDQHQESLTPAANVSAKQAAPATTVRVHEADTSVISRRTTHGASICSSSVREDNVSQALSKCCVTAAVMDSSADGQTDGTESSEGDAESKDPNHVFCREKRSTADREASAGRPVSGGVAGATEKKTERVPAKSERVAWDMLEAALHTLEAIGQMGSAVVRNPSEITSQSNQFRRPTITDEASKVKGQGPMERFPTCTKLHVLQRLEQSRKICQMQWAEVGAALSSAFQKQSSLQQALLRESSERRRQEHKARRLHGALQHLLAQGEPCDWADDDLSPTGMEEEPPGKQTAPALPKRPSPGACLEQTHREGLVVDHRVIARARGRKGEVDPVHQDTERVDFGGSLTNPLGRAVAWGLNEGAEPVPANGSVRK